jgi:hypothetical protein
LEDLSEPPDVVEEEASKEVLAFHNKRQLLPGFYERSFEEEEKIPADQTGFMDGDETAAFQSQAQGGD